MPGWPSAPERRALDAFPGQIGPEDLEAHFKLSPADRRFVLGHRGDGRLGVAVQPCSLRWLGFVPDELTALPQPALLSLCDQLDADPGELAGYGARGQTRADQFAAARRRAAFRAWDAMESGVLEHWLTVRAMEHERPKALFTLAAEQLHAQQIARPSVEQIVRLIGAARERAHRATFDALADQLTDRAKRARLDGLLELRADDTTWIEWPRTSARETSHHRPGRDRRAGPSSRLQRRRRTGEPMSRPIVGVVMGSDSGLPVMSAAAEALAEVDVSHEAGVVSAPHPAAPHTTCPPTPTAPTNAACGHDRRRRRRRAPAGHARRRHPLPVIGVPVPLRQLDGLDSLLSIAQMRVGVPVATVAIAGARNAGLLAVRILATADPALPERVRAFQAQLAESARPTDAHVRTDTDNQGA